MVQQPHKQTPYDQFNIEIPQKFPKEGISAAAANAIVNAETWTDANPMLNLSSFVTTYCEAEVKDIYDRHMYRNFADPDMYPHRQQTESTRSLTELRLSVLPRRVCWAVWPTSGIGGRLDRRREKMLVGQTW
jgi:glutamate/tyrosine decarboxylase-like PLP-dependent enzyme